jgi:hypothetical protein
MSWVGANRYLLKEEMEQNAIEIYTYFKRLGWTDNSISAMLGNMETESTINPNIWEGLTVDIERGYGLVQWTPSTKYTEWAGDGYENGIKQCERIQYEVENGLQWFSNPNAPIVEPPMTFKEFTQSTEDITTLANYFLWYYEHPAVTIQSNRGEQAIQWYNFLLNSNIPTPVKPRKKMPIWLMCKRRH